MATVTINGAAVDIGDQRLNCVQAAKIADVEIPHYCWHPALSVVASCRMCLVEVGDKKPDGTVAMQPKLVPGCQTPVKDGTVVVTNSKKVKDAQAQTLEFLLLNHPLDCPTCDQAGECFLQDYSFNYGRAETRLREPKTIKIDKTHIGDQITLFTDRCIMCSRCVRFTREISGTAELQVINRGDHAEIDIFPGQPCNNKLAGNVVDLCPVGALCSKDFLYKQRVWWLQTQKSICSGCTTGCSIYVDQAKDHIYRIRPRFNPEAQGHFMCDDGRFGFKYVQSPERLTAPRFKSTNGAGGPTWEKAYAEVRSKFATAIERNASAVQAVLSPWMAVEEAYLLAKHLKQQSPAVRLALGPVRIEGVDDHYPKDCHGNAQKDVKFTIHAEKCPNRIGVSAVIRHFEGSVTFFDQVLKDIEEGRTHTLYLVGGDPKSWITEAQAATLGKLDFFVLQDLLPSAALAHAHVVLPGGAFVEREGTFVNTAGLAQQFKRAVNTPGEARPDGRLLVELTGRTGLFHPASLRKEIAAEIPYFAPLAVGDLGEYGVKLGV